MIRYLWLLGGFVGVAVGAIGIVLPGLPTTGPFIFAAWCFSKSSPRFEQWILGLPGIGPLVIDYRSGKGMPRRAKTLALTMMWSAIFVSTVFLLDNLWIRIAVWALGAIGSWWILIRIPTSEALG